MIQLNWIGIVLLLILATAGGYLTGMFAAFLYDFGCQRFPRKITLMLSVVFYVVPIWGFVSLWQRDGLFWFYAILLVFYYLGIKDNKGKLSNDRRSDNNYEPYD